MSVRWRTWLLNSESLCALRQAGRSFACANELTHGQTLDTSASMPAPILAPPALGYPSLLGMVLWRLAATLLYACSLVLIPHDLPAAVFALLAALVCLPGARAALRERTGLRVGGVVAASGAAVLLLCAVVSPVLQADAPVSSAGAAGAVVVSASLTGKP